MVIYMIFQLTMVQLKKEDILNTHQYLIVKNNIKQCLSFLKRFNKLLISIVNASNHKKMCVLK